MKKQRKSHSEINYWQSNTDMMTGLVLILVLIILLLILYLMQIPEDTLPDAEEGDGYTVDNQLGDAMDDDYDAGGDYDNDDDDDWDGAGGRTAVKKSTRKRRTKMRMMNPEAAEATTTAEIMNSLILLPVATSGEKPPSMPQL